MSFVNVKNFFAISFLSLLTLVVLADSFLILWILTSGGFFKEGSILGSSGFWTSGDIFALKSIFAKSIRSGSNRPLILQSSDEIALKTRNDKEKIVLNQEGLKMTATFMELKNTDGDVLFKVSDDETVIPAKNLLVSHNGGLKLNGKVQSQKIYSGPGNKLSLSSRTDRVLIKGPKGVHARSFSGNFTFSSFEDIVFRTKNRGKVIFESGSLFITSLRREGTPSRRSHGTKKGASARFPGTLAYQLCSCHDGKLFVAHPKKSCVADYHICSI